MLTETQYYMLKKKEESIKDNEQLPQQDQGTIQETSTEANNQIDISQDTSHIHSSTDNLFYDTDSSNNNNNNNKDNYSNTGAVEWTEDDYTEMEALEMTENEFIAYKNLVGFEEYSVESLTADEIEKREQEAE